MIMASIGMLPYSIDYFSRRVIASLYGTLGISGFWTKSIRHLVLHYRPIGHLRRHAPTDKLVPSLGARAKTLRSTEPHGRTKTA